MLPYNLYLKISIWGFLRSLITNPMSKIQNSKWRIQYGGQKYQNQLHSLEICYLEVFEVADYESDIKN
jgi:hypothetical protein